MAHKTIVGGTTYSVTGGKSMVSGTSYSISLGKTNIDGVTYDITFKPQVFAMLYTDGSMVFQQGNKVEEGKTLSISYTNFVDKSYYYFNIPWKESKQNIKNISFNNISIINMSDWFSSCFNLTNINYDQFDIDNVTDMSNTYYSCHSLTGSPVCGENVIDMHNTYAYCYNLTGSPVCGPNVTDMSNTYNNCHNLTGSPVCGPNVTSMSNTYMRCRNLMGNAYFYSTNVSDMTGCFYNRNVTNILRIYIINNSTTLTTALRNDSKSMVGATITWTNDMAINKYYYNATSNIYIYPVDEDMENFRLNNEYDEENKPNTDINEYINITNNTVSINTEYAHPHTELIIDTGYAFIMTINTEQLVNLSIEKTEVK